MFLLMSIVSIWQTMASPDGYFFNVFKRNFDLSLYWVWQFITSSWWKLKNDERFMEGSHRSTVIAGDGRDLSESFFLSLTPHSIYIYRTSVGFDNGFRQVTATQLWILFERPLPTMSPINVLLWNTWNLNATLATQTQARHEPTCESLI